MQANITLHTVQMADLPFIDLKAQYRRLKPDIRRRIEAVLEHGQFILGPEVAELEAELAKVAAVEHAIAVSSGTDALIMALMEAGIGPGDAVYVPGFTFTASAEVILLVGARPVFVDIEGDSFNIDVAHLAHCIEATKNYRPAAVIAVDLFGLAADYDALHEVCDGHGLLLIADAAQSFGGARRGRPVGALAPVSATSFFPAKPLGGYGDGGALFTDDGGRAERYRSIRMHGQGSDRYEVVRVGINGRLDTLQAAVLLVKLTVLADEIEARERVARRYDDALGQAVTLPPRQLDCQSAWAQYSILLDQRDRVREALAAEGIPSQIYYLAPMHLQPAYRDFGTGPGSLPISEDVAGHILSLPMHPYLDEATVDRIADAVCRAVSAGG